MTYIYHILYKEQSSSLRQIAKTPFFMEKTGFFVLYYCVLWCTIPYFVTKFCC